MKSGGPAARLLPALVLISGFCGISYEILYARFLGNLLGQQFVINATVLLTFLLGIGFGTLRAHRLLRRLWAIEAGIGLYATAMVAAQNPIERAVFAWLPGIGTNIYLCSLTVLALLAIPAFLIGCSVPLFAAYLEAASRERVFSRTYAIYNLGAALTAIALEFLLLRAVGLRSATLMLAGLNLAVAAGVLAIDRIAGVVPVRPSERRSFSVRAVSALILASLASAIFQLLMIKLAEFMFGPYSETFSMVLATVLLGIAAGAWICGRLRLSFGAVLGLALAGVVWLLAGWPGCMAAYAALYPHAAQAYWLLVPLKLALVVVLMGLPAAGFGATIPALLGEHRDIARESGWLLFCSSLANAAGFALMAFWLHQYLDYGPILLVVAVLTGLAVLVHDGLRVVTAVAFGWVLLAAGALAGPWDEELLYIGYTSFHSRESLEYERESNLEAERFKGPQDVFGIIRKDDVPYFFINGYISIPIAGENASEKLVGAMSSMLSPRLDRALVLGLGSGATAGAVGSLFEQTDVVEINKAVLSNVYRLARYNYDVENMPGLSIVHDDGIRYVKATPERYSLILNTVSTPLYFSSSKLYTRDFLEQVSRKLTPDGIYVTWVDGRIGDRGMDIILETLTGSFPECWMFYLDATYLLLTCSNQEIEVRQLAAVASNRQLREEFAEEKGLALNRLPYSIISTRVADLTAPDGAPVNTLDYPTLEHEMSRLQSYTYLYGFKRRLEQRLDLERLRTDVGRRFEWDPVEFLVHADVMLRPSWRLTEIFHAATDRLVGGVSAEAYERAALAQAAAAGTGRAYLGAGRRLWRGRRYGAAVEALSRGLELDPSLGSAHYYLGRSFEGLEDWEAALEQYVVQWTRREDERMPVRAAGVLIRLGRPAEALDWLERAGPEPKQGADFAYYTGAAHEQLGDPAAAARHYEQALEREPEDRRSRAALDRLRASPTTGDLPESGPSH